jgi:hypothetical protein
MTKFCFVYYVPFAMYHLGVSGTKMTQKRNGKERAAQRNARLLQFKYVPAT